MVFSYIITQYKQILEAWKLSVIQFKWLESHDKVFSSVFWLNVIKSIF